MSEIGDMTSAINTSAAARDKALNSALKLSEKFYDLSTDVMSGLRDLKDSLYSQEPPGVDPDQVKEQQGELAVSCGETFKLYIIIYSLGQITLKLKFDQN